MATYHMRANYLNGETMMVMNMAYHDAWKTGEDTELIFYWPQPPEFKFRQDDPETQWERINYIQQFYLLPELVKVTHIFNYTDPDDNFPHLAWWFKRNDVETDPRAVKDEWLFDPLYKMDEVKGKIVVWDWRTNKTPPQYECKRKVDCWEDIYSILHKHFDQVVRIHYTTPIKEAFFHITTAEQVASYCGNWHYISRNFGKPHYVFTKSHSTSFHTPQAIQYENNREVLTRLETDITKGRAVGRAQRYWNGVLRKYTDETV